MVNVLPLPVTPYVKSRPATTKKRKLTAKNKFDAAQLSLTEHINMLENSVRNRAEQLIKTEISPNAVFKSQGGICYRGKVSQINI